MDADYMEATKKYRYVAPNKRTVEGYREEFWTLKYRSRRNNEASYFFFGIPTSGIHSRTRGFALPIVRSPPANNLQPSQLSIL